MEHEKNSYSYRAPTEKERQEIETIRDKYLDGRMSPDFKSMIRLDRKVRRLSFYPALFVGLLGFSAFGGGLALLLHFEDLPWGLSMTLLGLFLLAVSYPVNTLLSRILRRKYGPKILALSENLLKKEDEKKGFTKN